MTCNRSIRKALSLAMVLVMSGAAAAAKETQLSLRNDHVLRELRFDGKVWRTTRLARGDGTDEIRVQSDEFHIRFMDDAFLTLDHYQAVGKPMVSKGMVQSITIMYKPRQGLKLPDQAPREITIVYTLANEPDLRKTVTLHMKKGQAIYRSEVERFTTTARQSRGGRGEPVYLNDKWFVGAEFPACYTRHTDGNTPKAYSGKFDKKVRFSQLLGSEEGVGSGFENSANSGRKPRVG